MTPRQAALKLGLSYDQMSPGWGSDIRAAYAACIKFDHPDLGGAGNGIAAFKEARDVLLEHFEGKAIPQGVCTTCNGKRTIPDGFRAIPCPKCKPAPPSARPAATRRVSSGGTNGGWPVASLGGPRLARPKRPRGPDFAPRDESDER